MNFSDITRSVNEAWNFILPPVLYLLFGLAILWLIAGKGFGPKVRPWLGRFRIDALRSPRNYKTLESYGLAKLMPIAAFLTIVFALYMTNRVVGAVGSAVPIQFTYRRDVLYAPRISGRASLAILQRHTNVQSASDFVQALDDDAGRIQVATKDYKTSPLASRDSWREQAGDQWMRFNAAKFFLLWCLVCLWSVWRKMRIRGFWTFVRFLSAILFCVAVGAWFLFKHLYALEQESFAHTNAVAAWNANLTLNDPKAKEPPPTAFAGLEQNVESDLRGENWWKLRFWDPNYLRWVLRTIRPYGGS